MGLYCSCPNWEPEPGDWIHYGPKDYAPLAATRAKRCCSCKELIRVGDLACEVPRFKIPYTEIECKIYGEDGEAPIASWWFCERCADLFWSLEELGFCVPVGEDVRELVRDYATDYGPERHTGRGR